MTVPAKGSSRERILARIRAAVQDAAEPPPVLRDYRDSHQPDDPARLLDLLAANLADYRAVVHRCTGAELPAVIGRILAERGSRTLLVPDGVPEDWLSGTAVERVRDHPPLAPDRLDAVDSVLTGCALAVAETGTIVLDAGPGQGRRALTLVPDHHLCVVRTADQVVASVPQALPRLDPSRPQTWISGPSATSDIELDRVEGVHGPRTLEVVLVG
ncbi:MULTISPECIES: LUD domain-containing protein [Streptacidiphilus]|uniref:Lactate utilization protein C n=1 Tax=Streptacidiphilus cavernicola TaxID=3342716 RepID=A0ABV6UKL5_9ACTN|nr:LUD domain-containing protein [Streptacidiphilus jeojiense]